MMLDHFYSRFGELHKKFLESFAIDRQALQVCYGPDRKEPGSVRQKSKATKKIALLKLIQKD